MNEYLIVFYTNNTNIGNIVLKAKEINLKQIKECIEEEFGHKPKKTIILNIVTLNTGKVKA